MSTCETILDPTLPILYTVFASIKVPAARDRIVKTLILSIIALAIMWTGSAVAGEPLTLKNYTSPGESKKTEPMAKKFSLESAVHFLDSAALDWTATKSCFSCHTNFAFLYARPGINANVSAHADIRRSLEEMVTDRWQKKGPRWDAEVVASAAALAFNDAGMTGKLHPVTKTALDRMWTVQKKDGGFSWLKCAWPPMENDDHYGVTLAALAVGFAPEDYAKSEAAQRGLEGLRRWLKANPPDNLHHKVMMLWVSTYLDGFFRDAEAKAATKELLAVQRPDGGWSAASLGNWKRADKLQQDPTTSDGYGTGFVIYVLRRAGVPASEPRIQKGVAWLKNNQRESGRWFTRSLNRDNKHYLTHAGTAFAIMALTACEEKTASASR